MEFLSNKSLPSDMIFEVLCRTDLQTIDKCKSLSKKWEQELFSSSFLIFYCKVTGNIIGYIVQSLVRCKHKYKFVSPCNYTLERSLNFSPFINADMKIEASSQQGILCCVRSIGTQYRYYVSKPCTNQWQAIPNPRCPFPYYSEKVALAVVNLRPLHYKIIRISCPKFLSLEGDNHYICQIFDSKNWEWKGFKKDPVLSMENNFVNNTPTVCANGLAYFLREEDILAVCLHRETLFKIKLPKSFLCKKVCSLQKRIIQYQGKLGLIYNTGENVELWVLKDRGGGWEIRKQLNTDAIAKEISYPSVVDFIGEEITLVQAYEGTVFWNFINSGLDKNQARNLLYVGDIFPFRSDWEEINLKKEVNFDVQSKKKINKSKNWKNFS